MISTTMTTVGGGTLPGAVSAAKVYSRLPSLDNLLESEVILGDDDSGSSLEGDDSEMHSALEELSESTSTTTNDCKFLDCSISSSTADAVEPTLVQCGETDEPDLSLTFSQSYYADSGTEESSHASLSLTQSYYKDKPSAIRQMIPRSSTTMSTQCLNGRCLSRGTSPRPSYAENTASSKMRVSPSSHVQPPTPTGARKFSPYLGSARPIVPPKPAALSRQTSNLRPYKTPADSPMTARRSVSVSAPPSAKLFVATGRQASVVSRSKPVTPTKPPPTPPTPRSLTTTPRREDRFSSLGRRPTKLTSPSTAEPARLSLMETSLFARDTKSAADKFATLPRRKAKDRPPIPKFRDLDTCSSPVAAAASCKIDGGATLPRPKKLSSSPTGSQLAVSNKMSPPTKPKVLIYLEKSAQTELSTEDILDGQAAAIRLRSLTWHHQHNEEVRQLERKLQQVIQLFHLIKNS